MHTTLSTSDFIIQMREFRLETFMFVLKLIQTKHNSSELSKIKHHLLKENYTVADYII